MIRASRVALDSAVVGMLPAIAVSASAVGASYLGMKSDIFVHEIIGYKMLFPTKFSSFDRVKETAPIIPLPTGSGMTRLADFDCAPRNVVVLNGRQGSGRSTVLRGLAREAAQAGRPVAYISMKHALMGGFDVNKPLMREFRTAFNYFSPDREVGTEVLSSH